MGTEGKEDRIDRAIDGVRANLKKAGDVKAVVREEAKPETYLRIMDMRSDSAGSSFRQTFSGYYSVRRADSWKEFFFDQFRPYKQRPIEECTFDNAASQPNNDFALDDILKTLFGREGTEGRHFVDLSFASKMIATLDPSMPIWDGQVETALRNANKNALGLRRIQGDTDRRRTIAVKNYELLCAFYEKAFKEGLGGECVELFDGALPEYADKIPPVKKMDFVLWALGSK